MSTSSSEIINLSINQDEFINQINNCTKHLEVFEKNLNIFQNKINGLKFDANFEKINDNITTLNKNVEGNFSKIDNTIEKTGNSISNSILPSLDSINDKFSLLGVTGLKVINSVSDSLIGMTKNLLNTMTGFDNVISSIDKYQIKNTAIRTIMNSVTDDKVPESYASKIDYVTESLSKLETFADETSYDFTQMTSAIGQFTSLGNDLETAANTVLGMANWISLVGKSSGEFSSLAWTMQKVAGMKYVGLQQFQSLSTFFDPQTKQNVLDAAVALGTLRQNVDGTYQTLKGTEVGMDSFSTNLSEKWLTMDVLNSVMGKYSEFANAVIEYMDETSVTASEAIKKLEKDYDSVSVQSFKSAQEAKTFGEAIQSVQVAVQTGWAKSFEYIFGNVEIASKNFTELANQLYSIFAEGKYVRNQLLKLWSEGGGRDTIVSALLGDVEEIDGVETRVGGLVSTIGTYISTIKETVQDVFGLLHEDAGDDNVLGIYEMANAMLDLSDRFKEFTKSLEPTDEMLQNLRTILYSVTYAIKTFISAIVKIGKFIIQSFSPVLPIINRFAILFSEVLYTAVNRLAPRFELLATTLKNGLYPIFSAMKPTLIYLVDRFEDIVLICANLIDIFDNLITSGVKLLKQVFNSKEYTNFYMGIYNIGKALQSAALDATYFVASLFNGTAYDYAVAKISELNDELQKAIDATESGTLQEVVLNWLRDNIINPVKNLDLKEIPKIIKDKFDNIVKNISEKIKGTRIEEIIDTIKELILRAYNFIKEQISKIDINSLINNISSIASNFISNIKNIFNKVVSDFGLDKIFNDIVKKFNLQPIINNISNILGKAFEVLKNVIQNIIQTVSNIASQVPSNGTGILDKIVGFISNIKEGFIKILANLNIQSIFNNIVTSGITLAKTGIDLVTFLVDTFSNSSLIKLLGMGGIILGVIVLVKKILQPVNDLNEIKMKKEDNKSKIIAIVGIVAIAGSLALLSLVPTTKLLVSAVVIAAMIIAINMVSKLSGAINDSILAKKGVDVKKVNQSFDGISKIAVSLLLAIIAINSLKSALAKSPVPTIAAIIVVLTAIYGLTKFMEASWFTKMAAADNDNKKSAGGFMSLINATKGLLTSVSTLLAFTQKINLAEAAKLIAAAAISVAAIGGSMLLLNMAIEKVTAYAKIGPKNGDGDEKSSYMDKIFGNLNVANLTALSLVIKTLSSALQELAQVPFFNLVSGTAVLAGLIVTIGLLGNSLSKAAPTITSMTILIAAFALSIKVMDGCVSGLIIFETAITAFAVALIALKSSFEETTKGSTAMQKNVLVLVALIVSLTAAIKLMDGCTSGLIIFASTLTIITVAIAALAVVIGKNTKVVENISTVLLSMSITVLAVAVAIKIISSSFDALSNISGKVLLGLLAIAVGLGACAVVLLPFKPLLDGIGAAMQAGAEAIKLFITSLKDIDFSAITKGLTELPGKIAIFFKGIPEQISKLWETIKSKGPELLNKIGEFFKKIPGYITKIGPIILEKGKEIGSNIIKGLGNGFKSLPELAKNFFGGFLDKVKNIFGIHSPSTEFKDMGTYMVVGLDEGLGGLGKLASKVFGDFKNAAMEKIKELEGSITNSDLFKNLKERSAFSNLFDFSHITEALNRQKSNEAVDKYNGEQQEIANAAAEAFRQQKIMEERMQIIENMKNAISSFVENIKSMANSFITTFSSIGKAILSPFLVIWATIKPLVDKIFDSLFPPKERQTEFVAETKSTFSFINACLKVVGGLLNGILGVFNFFVNIIKIIINSIGMIANAIRLTYNDAIKFIQIIQENIKPIIDAVVNFFVNIYNTYIKPVIDAVVNFFVNIYNTYIKPVIDAIVNGVKNIGSVVQSIGNFFVNIYNKYIKPVIDAVVNFFVNIYNTYIKPVINAIAKGYKKYIKPILDPIVKFLDKIGSLINDVGHAIDSGVSNSAHSLHDLIQREKEMIKQAIAEIKGVLDAISKWFDEHIGFIADGIGFIWNGIKSTGEAIANLPETVSNIAAATTEVNERMSKVADLGGGFENLADQVEEADEQIISAEEEKQMAIENTKAVLDSVPDSDYNKLGMPDPEEVEENAEKIVEATQYTDEQLEKSAEKRDEYLETLEDGVDSYNSLVDSYAKINNDQSEDLKDSVKMTDEALDKLVQEYEDTNEEYAKYIAEMDENMTDEDKALAKRITAYKVFKEKFSEVANSGFSFDATGNSSYTEEYNKTDIKTLTSNQNSVLEGYKNFINNMFALSKTGVSNGFLQEVFTGGPSGDLYKNIVNLGQKDIEAYAAGYDAIHGQLTADSNLWFQVLDAGGRIGKIESKDGKEIVTASEKFSSTVQKATSNDKILTTIKASGEAMAQAAKEAFENIKSEFSSEIKETEDIKKRLETEHASLYDSMVDASTGLKVFSSNALAAEAEYNNWIDKMAADYEQSNDEYKEYIKNLDKNLTEEQKIQAKRLKAQQIFTSEWKVNSGFSWDATGSNAYSEDTTELKVSEIKKNQQSYFAAYQNFVKQIKKLAKTGVSDAFLKAVWTGGPSGELYKAVKAMGQADIEEYASNYDAMTDYQNEDSAVFQQIMAESGRGGEATKKTRKLAEQAGDKAMKSLAEGPGVEIEANTKYTVKETHSVIVEKDEDEEDTENEITDAIEGTTTDPSRVKDDIQSWLDNNPMQLEESATVEIQNALDDNDVQSAYDYAKSLGFDEANAYLEQSVLKQHEIFEQMFSDNKELQSYAKATAKPLYKTYSAYSQAEIDSAVAQGIQNIRNNLKAANPNIDDYGITQYLSNPENKKSIDESLKSYISSNLQTMDAGKYMLSKSNNFVDKQAEAINASQETIETAKQINQMYADKISAAQQQAKQNNQQIEVSAMSNTQPSIAEKSTEKTVDGSTVAKEMVTNFSDQMSTLDTTTATTAVTTFMNNLLQTVKTFNGEKESSPWFKESQNIVIALTNGLTSDPYEQLKAKALEVITATYNTTKNFIETGDGGQAPWFVLGQKIDNQLANGMYDKRSEVIKMASQVCQDAITAATITLGIDAEQSSQFYRIGEYMVDGLTLSIKAGESSVTTAIADTVIAMAAAAEEEAEIESPSKLFYGIGDYIVQGLANGVSENATLPVAALSDTIGAMADQIMDDQSYSPTITPVLDLTELSRQSGQINTLFANQQAMRISATMRDNQNGGNNGQSVVNNYNFTQNNTSPVALNDAEIYRQTYNQFNKFKERSTGR